MADLIFNANNHIKVRLTDDGILHAVENHNSILPARLHTSFNEYKNKADKDGLHRFQLWDFIDIYGGLGMELYKYVDLNFVFNSNDLEHINQ